MKVKAKDIKVGNTIDNLKIISEIEKSLFTCSCSCGNIFQRLAVEIEMFPPFRACNECMRTVLHTKTLWGELLDLLIQWDQKERTPPKRKFGGQPFPKMRTRLLQILDSAHPYHFDEFSRTLTLIINFMGPRNPEEFLMKQRHIWEPIAQKVLGTTGNIKFTFYSPGNPF